MTATKSGYEVARARRASPVACRASLATLRSVSLRRASPTETMPDEANMHSFLEHVGGTSGIGRRTPTTESQTWHRSRSIYPLSHIWFLDFVTRAENYRSDRTQTPCSSRLLRRLCDNPGAAA